jgi:hypothetical protein
MGDKLNEGVEDDVLNKHQEIAENLQSMQYFLGSPINETSINKNNENSQENNNQLSESSVKNEEITENEENEEGNI